MFPVRLFGSIGLDKENDSDDVASVGNSLVDLGLDGARDAADTGAWDNHFDSSVKFFQEHNGLDIAGVLHPGGPTEAALNQSLELRRGAHEASWHRSEQQFDAPRGFSAEKALVAEESNIALPRRTFDSPHQEQNVWEGNADLPRISDGAATAIAESARQSKTQLDNFLRLLDQPPIRGALPEAAAISTEPNSDEVERVLTARGFRYSPDPMGRVGWGDWADAQGNRVEFDALQERAIFPGTTGRTSGMSDHSSFAHEVLRTTRPEDFADPESYLEAIKAAVEDGVIPAGDSRELLEMFARIVAAQRGFGAKTIRLPGSLGGRPTHPPELSRRLDGISHERTRVGIEQVIKGSVPEKNSFRQANDFVLKKFGDERNMVADFWTAVRLAGGRFTDVEHRGNGLRLYKATDGTTFIMRRFSDDGRPTNEFHIVPPGGRLTRIKIRYEKTYP